MSGARLREKPLDLGIIDAIDPKSFQEIIIDKESKELFDLGEIGQRYAYVRSYKVGYGLNIKKLKKDPEAKDLLPNSLGVMEADGQITVFWVENKIIENPSSPENQEIAKVVVSRAFPEESVPKISRMLQEFKDESSNPILIDEIVSQYRCVLQGKWHMRIRPGYSSDTPTDILEQAAIRFNHRYVVAKEGNIGIVHRDVEKQVSQTEPALFRPDPRNPRIYEEAGSFWKIEEGILWVNRSTANININKKNNLALVCLAYYPTKFDFIREKFTFDYHLERSSEEMFFCTMAEEATIQFNAGGGAYFKSENFSEGCYSFDFAETWREIYEMEESQEKIAIIHNMLMRTIYISSGISPDKDGDGLKPLIARALKVAEEEKISLNLDYIPEGFDIENGTALQLAIARGYIDVANLLIDHGATIDANIFSLIISKKNIPLLQKIVKLDNIDTLIKLNDELLLFLLENHEFDLLTEYIAKGLTFTQDKLNRYLNYAISLNDILMVRKLFLLKADANSKETGTSPLFFAIWKSSSPEIIEELFKYSADPNDNNPLLLAILKYNGDKTLITKLLSQRADVNQETTNKSPLKLAMEKKNSELVNLLLDHKADPSLIKSPTALHLAINIGDIEIFKRIKTLDPRVNECDETGKIPFLKALDCGALDIAKNLQPDNFQIYEEHYQFLVKFISEIKDIFEDNFQDPYLLEVKNRLETFFVKAYQDFGNLPENKQEICQPLEELKIAVSELNNEMLTAVSTKRITLFKSSHNIQKIGDILKNYLELQRKSSISKHY